MGSVLMRNMEMLNYYITEEDTVFTSIESTQNLQWMRM